MAKDERREHLLLVVNHLLEVWNAWSANSDVRYVTRTFEDAVNDALLVFGDGSIPGDMRTLNVRMDVLREQWAAWNRKNESSGGKYPIPDNAFWKALEAIEAAQREIVKPIRRNLETIPELTAQKVPDAQICKIYGFTDTGRPDGSPELWMLREEREQPGRHTDRAKGWLPPWEKQQKNEEAKQLEAIERIKRQREGKMKLLVSVAPESIEELVAQGVTGKQLCRMKKIDEGEMVDYCKEHGLTVPPWESLPANQTSGIYDFVPEDEAATVLEPEKAADSAEPTAAEPIEEMTLEQEIVMYHRLGTMTPEDIAKAVSRPGNEVTARKVGRVVARWEREPSAFETSEV